MFNFDVYYCNILAYSKSQNDYRLAKQGNVLFAPVVALFPRDKLDCVFPPSPLLTDDGLPGLLLPASISVELALFICFDSFCHWVIPFLNDF